jgi:hypothetical protein
MKVVSDIEGMANKLVEAKQMEKSDADELLREADKVHERLLKLDGLTVAPQTSRERKSLMLMITRLREHLMEERLPELQLEEEDEFAISPEQPAPTPTTDMEVKDLGGGQFITEEKTKKPGPLAAARAVRRHVSARYAAVQHTLTEEQRRAMRTRIARLSSFVRQAEDDAWSAAYQQRPPPPPEPPPAPIPEPETTRLQETIRLAVASASESAAVVASAVLASAPVKKPASRGILRGLTDAFKLK